MAPTAASGPANPIRLIFPCDIACPFESDLIVVVGEILFCPRHWRVVGFVPWLGALHAAQFLIKGLKKP